AALNTVLIAARAQRTRRQAITDGLPGGAIRGYHGRNPGACLAGRWARDCYNGAPPERRQRHEREDVSFMVTSVKRRKQVARASKRGIRSKPGKPTRTAAKPARSRGPA